MRRFVSKGLLFTTPIIALHLFTFFYYSTDKGDLLRLGYIIDMYPAYREIFTKEFNREKSYCKISDQTERRQYKVLTIGDSFSEQGNFGYQNYLNSNIDLLHFDRKLHENSSPIQTLYSLLNGDFLDHYKFEFIVLQSVERQFIEMSKNLDTTKAITVNAISEKLDRPNMKKIYSTFYSEKVFKFPYYTLQYFIKNDFHFPQVYKVGIYDELFSVKRNELLFYDADLQSLKLNNNKTEVSHLNDCLNDLASRLRSKNIKLIVLPSPDKYDMYYESIIDKENYLRPEFFKHMSAMSKNYIYIDSKKVIGNYLNIRKDLYFYDDTHWSPWSSCLIGQEISRIVRD